MTSDVDRCARSDIFRSRPVTTSWRRVSTSAALHTPRVDNSTPSTRPHYCAPVHTGYPSTQSIRPQCIWSTRCLCPYCVTAHTLSTCLQCLWSTRGLCPHCVPAHTLSTCPQCLWSTFCPCPHCGAGSPSADPAVPYGYNAQQCATHTQSEPCIKLEQLHTVHHPVRRPVQQHPSTMPCPALSSIQ